LSICTVWLADWLDAKPAMFDFTLNLLNLDKLRMLKVMKLLGEAAWLSSLFLCYIYIYLSYNEIKTNILRAGLYLVWISFDRTLAISVFVNKCMTFLAVLSVALREPSKWSNCYFCGIWPKMLIYVTLKKHSVLNYINLVPW